MAFDAGTAWLQILPSFKGLTDAFDKEVARMGRQMDAVIAESIKNGFEKGSKDAKAAGDKAGSDFGASLSKGIKDGFDNGLKDAKSAGEKAGNDFGASLSKGIQKGLRDAKRDLSGLGRGDADRVDDRLGKAFAERGGMWLPKDFSDGEAAIDHLKEQIDDLRGQRITIDVDTATAVAAIEDLKRRLHELADSVDLKVRVSSAEALAELRAIKAEADDVDDSDPKVRVKTEGAPGALAALTELTDAAGVSSSRLGFLIAVGATLGTAIVPAAAAAAAAIGAIGVAAGAAAAGLGVSILGFSGIGGAVQAMDKYSRDSDKSTASLTKSQNAAARAADGVASAERSLANTRAQVASAARRAAQTVVDAQRSVVDAERNVVASEKDVADAKRDALRAEQDLTRAYRDAKRAREDQLFTIKETALAQRQANLDVAESKKQLDKVLANNRSTEAEKEAARVDYEERVLRLEELGVKSKRLAEDKVEADKKGISGSEQVVAAQEKVRNAQDRVASAQDKVRDAVENVAKANRKVADAVLAQKDQARQGAFQVAQAQQSVVNAVRAVESASVSAGVAGGSAMRNLQQAMEELSPTGQQFAKFLYGLKPVFLDLRNAAQGGLLPGVQVALAELLPYLPKIKQYIAEVASAVGDLFIKLIDGFRDPTWQAFFHIMAEQTVPMLQNLFTITGNVAKGIVGIVVAMSRFNGPIMNGLVRASEAFATWSANLGQSAGFQKFVDYVRQAGPAVVDMFKQFGILLFRIVEAAAPLGLTVVKSMEAIAQWINSWDLDTLNNVLTTIVAFYGGMLVATAVVKLGTVAVDALKAALVAYNFVTRSSVTLGGIWAGVQLTMEAATNGARTAFQAAGSEAGLFSRSLAGIKGGASGAGSALAGLLGAIGPGGFIVAGLAAAGIAALVFVNHLEKQKQAVDDLKSSMQSYADALKDGLTPQSVASAKTILQQNENMRGLVDVMTQAGISQDTLVRGLNGDQSVRRTVVDAINAQYNAEDKRYKLLDPSNKKEREASLARLDSLKAMRVAFKEKNSGNAESNRLTEVLEEQEKQAAAATLLHVRAVQELTPAQKEMGLSADSAAFAGQKLGEALTAVADATKTATEKADALKAADDAVFGAIRAATISAQDQALALLQVKDAGEQNAKQQMFGKATLDLHSEASIRNRQMLEQRLLALGQEFLADVRNGMAVDEASKKHDTNRDALVKAAKAAGFDAEQVDKLSGEFGTLPTDPRVTVTVTGVKEAMTQLKTAQIAEYALRNGLDPEQATREFNRQTRKAQDVSTGFAEGGAVFGPGGPTDDKVPAWLSNGEHVFTAAEVKAAGGHVAIEAFRKRLLSGAKLLFPGYAAGGAVMRPRTQPYLTAEWPAKFPMRVKIPTLEEMRAKYLVDTGGWPSSPAAQRGDSGVWHKVVALIKSTGPLSGTFGNAYRAGDPKWHGSGRAVDWMGYNQDALASFLAARKPLELIHRTNSRDYAYTRGRNMGSFNQALMEQHRNHIHAAFAKGGRVELPKLYDNGGWLDRIGINETGKPEAVLNQQQWGDISRLAAQGAVTGSGTTNNWYFRDTTLDPAKLQAIENRQAALARVGRPV